MNFRVGLASGALAAMLAALPAAFRAADGAPVWLALAGAAAWVLGPAAAGVRSLRPLPIPGRALLFGLGLATLPIAALAARIQLATHHRPLGAVAFALGAALLVAGAGLLALRVLLWAHTEPPPPYARLMTRALATVAALGPLLLVALELAQGPAFGMLDTTLAFGLCAILQLWRWPARIFRAAGMAALPLWAVLVASATWLALGPTGDAAAAASPALFAPLSWLRTR